MRIGSPGGTFNFQVGQKEKSPLGRCNYRRGVIRGSAEEARKVKNFRYDWTQNDEHDLYMDEFDNHLL